MRNRLNFTAKRNLLVRAVNMIRRMPSANCRFALGARQQPTLLADFDGFVCLDGDRITALHGFEGDAFFVVEPQGAVEGGCSGLPVPTFSARIPARVSLDLRDGSSSHYRHIRL